MAPDATTDVREQERTARAEPSIPGWLPSACAWWREDGLERGDPIAQGVAHDLAEGEDGGVADRVDRAVAGPGPGHQTGAGEYAQVLGGVLLAQAQPCGEFADAGWAGPQSVEQPDPGRFAEYAEPLCDELDDRLG